MLRALICRLAELSAVVTLLTLIVFLFRDLTTLAEIRDFLDEHVLAQIPLAVVIGASLFCFVTSTLAFLVKRKWFYVLLAMLPVIFGLLFMLGMFGFVAW